MNGKFPRSGLLLVDKPAGMSSAAITNQLKQKHRIERIGHGGTLDPFATGLLVVLVGEATKIARFMLEGEKEYEALARLGEETDSGDLDGRLLRECPLPQLSQSEWNELMKRFLGRQQQIPPVYSAIKVRGRPLYEYARKGQEVDVKPRDIHVTLIEALSCDERHIRFRVRSSGGTYIRVLANDIAQAAGSCAHLRELRRTASSQFRVNDAIPLENLLEMDSLPLLPLEQALTHLPTIEVDAELTRKIRQGNLAAFDSLRPRLVSAGYFLVVTPMNGRNLPVAVANHNPMLRPFCSIERVFDPSLLDA